MRIYFDLDDTLYPSAYYAKLSRLNGIRAIISLGIDKTEEELYNILKQILKEKGSNYKYHFDELIKRIGIETNKEKYIAKAVMYYRLMKTAIMPYPETKNVLNYLNKKGYSLYLLSQGIKKKQWEKIFILGIEDYFENILIVKKKDVKLYKRLKKGIMVGDNPITDIEYAKKAGHITIRIKQGKRKRLKSNADFEIGRLSELKELIPKIQL